MRQFRSFSSTPKYKRSTTFNSISEPFTFIGKDKIVLSQVKRDNNIVYGGQAIKRQIGPFARDTKDWDIFSTRPKQSANKLERSLDQRAGGDYYFVKPAQHEGTYKVRYSGFDRKRETEDDQEVADFTKPDRKVKYKYFDGIRYVDLSEVVKDKQKAVADKEFAFRHEKDKDDLQRIKSYKRFVR